MKKELGQTELSMLLQQELEEKDGVQRVINLIAQDGSCKYFKQFFNRLLLPFES